MNTQISYVSKILSEGIGGTEFTKTVIPSAVSVMDIVNFNNRNKDITNNTNTTTNNNMSSIEL